MKFTGLELVMESKKIVIIGSGYGGISAAKTLKKQFKSDWSVEIQIIDQNPFHTLLTELHEVAGGRVEPNAVKIPLTRIFNGERVTVIRDKIEHIDFESRQAKSLNHVYSYDYLILATGSRPFFFGLSGIERYGFKLWSLKEAVLLRDHICDCFHSASLTDNFRQRRKKLTFVIAGGGFTGVEMAGELGEWKNRLCKTYSIDEGEVSIYLLEALPNILSILDDKSANKCRKRLERLGVNVLTQSGIRAVDSRGIYLNNDAVIEGTLIWTAGIQGNPFVENMNIGYDRRYRVEVNEFLQSLQYGNVFCAGDTISMQYQNKPIPQIVETAVQSGRAAADNISRRIKNQSMVPFLPKYHGVMVSVGSMYAVARLKKRKLSGLPATALKHLVNLHYLFEIGGVRLAAAYLQHEFIERIVYAKLALIQEDSLNKQVTQFQ